MTAAEPINVEVLRRPSLQSNNPTSKAALVSASMPASNRNSMYIPSKSPSQLSLKETSVQTEQRLMHPMTANNDHEFEDFQQESEDLLVPGLDYEVLRLAQNFIETNKGKLTRR